MERAAEARENDQEQKLKRKQQERVKSMEDANEKTKMTRKRSPRFKKFIWKKLFSGRSKDGTGSKNYREPT